MSKKICTSLLVGILIGILPNLARADEVTDWNQIMLEAIRTAGNSGGILATRVGAIVQSSVFDALNGIERRYTPVHDLKGRSSGSL